MDMIEKVARVIAEKVGAVSSSTFSDIATTEDLRDAQLDICRVDLMAAARDAIMAMREPTDVMRDAAYNDEVWWYQDSVAGSPSGYPVELGTWQAMIDAALAEATPSAHQS